VLEFLAVFADPSAWIGLLTLTVLEIVLGIDNLVFLSILAGRLPAHQQPAARRLGLGFALATRIALLSAIVWIVGLTKPLFVAFDHPISWRDLILIAGGLFLIYKSIHEIHGSLEGEDEDDASPTERTARSFVATVVQIGIIDIVFSLDSVITAVGMAQDLAIMIAAVVIAMIVMLAASGPLSAFVERHPTVKMLALSFLLLIGMALIADGVGFHIPKGYIYAAMAFAVLVECLNLAARRKRKPVKLRRPPQP
jgi:predicted tellurium resistance membrane protein TerC